METTNVTKHIAKIQIGQVVENVWHKSREVVIVHNVSITMRYYNHALYTLSARLPHHKTDALPAPGTDKGHKCFQLICQL